MTLIRPNVRGKHYWSQNSNSSIEASKAAIVNLPASDALTTRSDSSIYYLAILVETDHTIVYVGLGSNLGDRAGNLLMAVRGLMEASFVVDKLSRIYETEPLEIESSEQFLNMVAEIHVTNVTPTQMMARLLRIEYLLGRTDKSGKKPRTVDLDILFFGDVQMETEFLTLPHPRLHLRRFVLTPLAAIAPNFVHPVLKTEIADLLIELDDDSEVKRWNPNDRISTEAATNS